MSERKARMDLWIFISTLVLVALGVVLVYSSSFAVAQERFGGADFFLERQLGRVVIGLAFFVLCNNIDYHVWGRAGGIAYVAGLALLVAVLMLPADHAVNGAKRWIGVSPWRFQVSEFAIMALILCAARRIDQWGDELREWKHFFNFFVRISLVALLVFLEPNFSIAAVVATIGMAILFVSRASLKHLAAVVAACVPVAVIGLMAAPYRRARVLSFLHGGDSSGIGYQASQALIGLGNGGLFGVGIGQGKEKLFYLPEPHTDFLFSVLGEELGFIGLAAVLFLFAFIVYRGFRIAKNAPDRMGQVMAFGFTFTLACYVMVHACVNVGLVPTTGVPLPFLSYGGMSLVFTMSSVGILLNISSQTRIQVPDARSWRQTQARRG